MQLHAIAVQDNTFSGYDMTSNCKNEARSVLKGLLLARIIF